MAQLKAKVAPPRKRKRRAKGTILEEYDYFDEIEIAKLFEVIRNKRDRAIFTLAYQKGLRAHEVGKLKLSDYRPKDGHIYIARGKNSIQRHYALTNRELIALRAWIKVRGTAPGPLFPSRQGKKGITRRRLDQLMKHYCELAGIDPQKAHMHALKHSCGTHLANRGESADVIQDWLGHRSQKSTEIYLHFTPKRRAEATERNRDW